MSYKTGFIAVIGRPNVGKSTLINQFIGQKLTITSHRPQTTRHRIHAVDTKADCQMIFIDTPGIHMSNKKALNSYMNKVASNALKDVDVVLWLVEIGRWTREDNLVLEHISKLNTPVILLINKIDKFKKKDDILIYINNLKDKYNAKDYIPISAFNNKDIDYLRKKIIDFLPNQKAFFTKDYITDRSTKFLAAEFIREKLMRNLAKELPYGLTVEIEKFEFDKLKKIYRIYALILVEKASQKSIVIGKQGEVLKKVGTDARYSIEGLLQGKTVLKLWVKVKTGWADDKRALQSLGYD